MKSLFLLIILTQNGGSDISASFVNTETLEQCQAKLTMLAGVFKGADIPLVESRCIESNLQFTKYDHALLAQKERYYYLLKFDETDVTISKTPDISSCMGRLHTSNKPDRSYCGSSVQSLR